MPAGVTSVLLILFLGMALFGLLSRTLADGPITVHRISGALSTATATPPIR